MKIGKIIDQKIIKFFTIFHGHTYLYLNLNLLIFYTYKI